MKTDQYQDKYEEITGILKEEKLDWDFEDFLSETENSESGKEKFTLWQKYRTFFSAAAAITFIGIMLVFFKFSNRNPKPENIANPQNSIAHNSVITVADSVQIKDSATAEISEGSEERKTIDKILPKRGRMRSTLRPRYASHQPEKIKEEIPAYNPEYVMVNGKKIYSEEEAIETTKKALGMVAEGVNMAFQETSEQLNNDF